MQPDLTFRDDPHIWKASKVSRRSSFVYPQPVVTQPSLSSLQFPSIIETEFLTPLPDGFIGHDDAALGEKILDIPETQAETMISPDRIADDLGRETIAGVTRVIALHGTSVSSFMPKLTMPFSL